MFYTQKKVDISVLHDIAGNEHGHNVSVIAFCKARRLNENGMVADFGRIAATIRQLDHARLNDILYAPPTGENIARWVVKQIPECYKASVQMSDGNLAVYIEDE